MTTPEGETDRALAERVIARGDARAFGALYDRHTPSLYRLALRLTSGDSPAAEDIVQDAWVRAVPRLGGFTWQSRLGTWLSGFVINLAREAARARSRGAEGDVSELASESEPALEGDFDRIDLERALSTLPHGYREVLILHDVEGYTHQEIAAALGIAAGTSKSQLFRARAAMRRALGSRNDREDHV